MRPEKQLLLTEIQRTIGSESTLVLARYQKLNPNLAFGLRSKLGALDGGMLGVKKRLLLKAAAVCGLTLDPSVIQGHIAVIYSQKNPIEMTKAVYQFMSENEEILEVIGGRFEGKTYSSQDVKAISQLPGVQEMRAQLLSVFEAPMARTLGAIDALLTSVAWCLENKSQQQ